MASFAPADLRRAGVRATGRPSLLIDDFARGWDDWYRLEWGNPTHWLAATRKLKDPKWRGDDDRALRLDVRTDKPNTLVFRVQLAAWGAYPGLREMQYFCAKPVAGTGDWETVTLRRQDLAPEQADYPVAMPSWRYVTELALASRATDRRRGAAGTVGGDWQGAREFRNLRWAPSERADPLPASPQAGGTGRSAPAPAGEPG
jgi:hypothetical protein